MEEWQAVEYAALEEVFAEPVGRRWLLKTFGVASVSAGLAAALGGCSTDSTQSGGGEQSVDVAEGFEARRLLFQLGGYEALPSPSLFVEGRRIPLQAITDNDRDRLRGEGGVLSRLDLATVTHHLPQVSLPQHKAVLVWVEADDGQGGFQIAALSIVSPTSGLRTLVDAASGVSGDLRDVTGDDGFLGLYGLGVSDVASADDVLNLASILGPPTTAVGLASLHPGVGNFSSVGSAATTSLLASSSQVHELSDVLTKMARSGLVPVISEPARFPDGSPVVVDMPFPDSVTTIPIPRMGLNPASPDLADGVASAAAAGVVSVRRDERLGEMVDKPANELPPTSEASWRQQVGAKPITVEGPLALGDTPSKWTVSAPQNTFDSQVTLQPKDQSDPRSVNVRLINNESRWVEVWVQYYDAGGNRLPIADKTLRSKDAEYVGAIPSGFVLGGVHINDVVYLDQTLKLPDRAVRARLIFAAPGLNGDTTWKTQFHEQNVLNYAFPVTETLFANLTTLVCNIFIPIFVTITSAINFVNQLRQGLLSVGETIKAPGQTRFFDYWHLLTNLGETFNLRTVALFAGFLAPTVGADIFANADLGRWVVEGFWIVPLIIAAISASPLPDLYDWIAVEFDTRDYNNTRAEFFGKAFALVALVATIVQGVESGSVVGRSVWDILHAPWTVEYGLSLTYTAEVTVSRDPLSASFPLQGRGVRVTPIVDGAVQPTSTFPINRGGDIRAEPLVVSVPEIPVGGTVQYQISVVTDDNAQVGAASIGPLPNNDSLTVPKKVSAEIRQQQIPVSSGTRFRRERTTVFDGTTLRWAGADMPVTATLRSPDAIAGNDATVATAAGMVGYSFASHTNNFLRNAGIVQTETQTPTFQQFQTEGLTLSPRVVYDPLTKDLTTGNNYLLEPVTDGSGYHLRRLTLGAGETVTWDPNLSAGYVPMTVDAAVVHPSGRVIALHTDSSRIAISAPTPSMPTLQATRAFVTAGPGDIPGLLRSPIAITVTGDGVIVALDAANARFAAFDLQGNPVEYFTSGYFAHLDVSGSTYLDLGVDGANFLYVLSYTGDGSQPEQYRLDLHAPDGAHISTTQGVPASKIAIDYWRNVTTLNYQPLTNTTNNQPYTPLGIPEPSLSTYEPQGT